MLASPEPILALPSPPGAGKIGCASVRVGDFGLGLPGARVLSTCAAGSVVTLARPAPPSPQPPSLLPPSPQPPSAATTQSPASKVGGGARIFWPDSLLSTSPPPVIRVCHEARSPGVQQAGLQADLAAPMIPPLQPCAAQPLPSLASPPRQVEECMQRAGWPHTAPNLRSAVHAVERPSRVVCECE